MMICVAAYPSAAKKQARRPFSSALHDEKESRNNSTVRGIHGQRIVEARRRPSGRSLPGLCVGQFGRLVADDVRRECQHHAVQEVEHGERRTSVERTRADEDAQEVCRANKQKDDF